MSSIQNHSIIILLRAIVLIFSVLSTLSASSVAVDEFFDFVSSQGAAETTGGLMFCNFGFTRHTIDISRRILGEMAPPQYRAHVAFFRMPTEAQDELDNLLEAFPERAHVIERAEDFESLCSVVLLAREDPRFNSEEIHTVARGPQVILGWLEANCADHHAYACRFFDSMWTTIANEIASCGMHFCAAVVPMENLNDPLLSAMDCMALRSTEAPPSVSSQWQQDWFVYHNLIRGTELDVPFAEGKGTRQGVFVDIGAFHPIHLSNTFFFERCLGWRGLCVEPNPSWAPYFRAYRPSGQLVQNCVWSRSRSVVMSFRKDPIEAYIQDEDAEDAGKSGAVLIEGNATGPTFTAECRTLEDILSSAGLRRPVTIDYMSVDAEAAEVEIFKVFPFESFDVSVISIEIQAANYYDLDVILSSAGYAKLAVLGGDHVYAKLKHQLTMPEGAAAWHQMLSKDFHAYAKPQTTGMGGDGR